MRRAGAGGQCEFGEGGWAHSTPGEHSDHCSVPSPGQARSSLLRAGKANFPYTSLKDERLQHPPVPPPGAAQPWREAQQGTPVLPLEKLCIINKSCIRKSSPCTSECARVAATLCLSGLWFWALLEQNSPFSIPHKRQVPRAKVKAHALGKAIQMARTFLLEVLFLFTESMGKQIYYNLGMEV